MVARNTRAEIRRLTRCFGRVLVVDIAGPPGKTLPIGSLYRAIAASTLQEGREGRVITGFFWAFPLKLGWSRLSRRCGGPSAGGRGRCGGRRRGGAAWTRGGRGSGGGLREEPQVTAKRIRRLLLPLAGTPVLARTVRRCVAAVSPVRYVTMSSGHGVDERGVAGALPEAAAGRRVPDQYREWRDVLPASLGGSAPAALLDQVCDLDLSVLEAVELPRGFGRDG